MTRRRLAIAGGIVALVACAMGIVGVVAWRSARTPSPTSPPATEPPSTARAGTAPATGRAHALAGSSATAPDPGPLPGSLEGTEADGAITADAAGHLVIDLELRRLFDHFLAATGEEPLAAIRARIVAVLRARLPETAAAEAIDLLDRYLAYREAARRLSPPPDPAAGLDRVHDLRARMFSPAVAQAFFADEEAAIRAGLARQAVVADGTLSPAERDRRLAEIDAQLPAAVREARAAATAPIDQMSRDQAMRAAGASDAEIAAARTAAQGADAAARLAELDRSRAAWTDRLARFRAARAALLADASLDDAVRRRRIDELLAQSFTPEERIRVQALDRIAAQPGGH